MLCITIKYLLCACACAELGRDLCVLDWAVPAAPALLGFVVLPAAAAAAGPAPSAAVGLPPAAAAAPGRGSPRGGNLQEGRKRGRLPQLPVAQHQPGGRGGGRAA
jgi:hypothetical protein